MDQVFADCMLDIDSRILWRGGTEVHVEPQVFDLLACLVRAQGRLVSYDDLIAEVWRGRIVSDAAIASRISAARSAVGDDGRRQAVIRTISRHGIQLAVEIRRLEKDPPTYATTPHRQIIRYWPAP
ncbi:winged helix-turn-helix domain-containing protein [Palleronia pelagia]|uniref:DNA-binding winged helix-turn-helix (WHTH) domain-containing protein n=1 Tax=Palleronia pelagia TaxID=387096 RepID=A0A1H8HDK4_9RHOB|nr:winged helix-turn-helix domain-containing protein [Palleronia pelagia]SEN54283.1 DNA-binding winged helix-turn-helix (wHTH) domain-containing protein [Palleronia pelagia]